MPKIALVLFFVLLTSCAEGTGTEDPWVWAHRTDAPTLAGFVQSMGVAEAFSAVERNPAPELALINGAHQSLDEDQWYRLASQAISSDGLLGVYALNDVGRSMDQSYRILDGYGARYRDAQDQHSWLLTSDAHWGALVQGLLDNDSKLSIDGFTELLHNAGRSDLRSYLSMVQEPFSVEWQVFTSELGPLGELLFNWMNRSLDDFFQGRHREHLELVASYGSQLDVVSEYWLQVPASHGALFEAMAQRIAGLVYLHYSYSGYFSEGSQWFQSLAQDLLPPAGSRSLYWAGRLERSASRYDEAALLFERSLRILGYTPDQGGPNPGADDFDEFHRILWYYLDVQLDGGQIGLGQLSGYRAIARYPSYYEDLMERGLQKEVARLEDIPPHLGGLERLPWSSFVTAFWAHHRSGDLGPVQWESSYISDQLYYHLKNQRELPGFTGLASIPDQYPPDVLTLLQYLWHSSQDDVIIQLFPRLSPLVEPQTIVDILDGYRDHGMYSTAIRLAFRTNGQGSFDGPTDVLRHLYPLGYGRELYRSAQEAGVDPYLLFGLAWAESAFAPRAVSRVGAQGLLQLMPATADQVADRLGIEGDAFTVEQNLLMGASYLSWQLERFGTVEKALAAYNAGPTRVNRWQTQYPDVSMDLWTELVPFEETRRYIRKVIAAQNMYRILYPDLPTRLGY